LQQQDATQDMALLWLNYYLKDVCTDWTNFNDSLANSQRITGQISCPMSAPVITQSGNLLTSTAAVTYQWLLNGQPIAGAVSQTYTPTQIGQYNVQATYGNNCPVLSNTINWLSTGLSAITNPIQFSLFPNPAADECVVEYTGLSTGTITLDLYSLTGQQVFTVQTVSSTHPGRITLDLQTLPAGVYWLRLTGQNGLRQFAKLVHE
jgi:hypothetical protein